MDVSKPVYDPSVGGTILPNGDIWRGHSEERKRPDNVKVTSAPDGEKRPQPTLTDEGMLQCPWCELEFESAPVYSRHVQKNHPPKPKDVVLVPAPPSESPEG